MAFSALMMEGGGVEADERCDECDEWMEDLVKGKGRRIG